MAIEKSRTSRGKKSQFGEIFNFKLRFKIKLNLLDDSFLNHISNHEIHTVKLNIKHKIKTNVNM